MEEMENYEYDVPSLSLFGWRGVGGGGRKLFRGTTDEIKRNKTGVSGRGERRKGGKLSPRKWEAKLSQKSHTLHT